MNSMNIFRNISWLCVLIALVFITAPVSAIYDFEGIPLRAAAQGEVQGDVLTFGTYGLTAPPIECTFSLPAKPVWARVYTGIWGGTERYTGWEEISVNNGVPARRDLFGKDDRNEETYVSGYGVYWVAHDCTDHPGGKNTIKLTTSRGQPESRIDGRSYGIRCGRRRDAANRSPGTGSPKETRTSTARGGRHKPHAPRHVRDNLEKAPQQRTPPPT